MAMANQPTLYELSGNGIHVTYATSSLPGATSGQPQFNYYDAFQAKNFTGNQIQTADNVLGRLVTVFLIQTIDSGSTTFTLLVPTANLPLSKVANITTEALRPCTNSRSSNRRRRQTELYPAVGLPWERSSRCRAPRS
jgi:hypothetical protein